MQGIYWNKKYGINLLRTNLVPNLYVQIITHLYTRLLANTRKTTKIPGIQLNNIIK